MHFEKISREQWTKDMRALYQFENPSKEHLEEINKLYDDIQLLKTMWYQRHDHKLPEWRKFCDWILTLPKFSELTGIEKEKNNADN